MPVNSDLNLYSNSAFVLKNITYKRHEESSDDLISTKV